MKLRAVVAIEEGAVALETWIGAAAGQPFPVGEPKACATCPLRVGGLWERNAREALAGVRSDVDRAVLRRWGCHDSARPCAGMWRILNATSERRTGDGS